MQRLNRSALVPYSAMQMYRLVEDVEQYPQFLDWCDFAAIESRDAQGVTASLGICYKGISKRFTTRNINLPGESIEMNLVDGPFNHLHGQWRFVELDESASKVIFELSYEVASRVLRPLLTTVFSEIADRQVDTFIQRAHRVYGESGNDG